ncbi:response regulator [Paenibacillus sp. GXUN7292]|uniref:response regulator n=1 Tax=Paenibacillus sp. GXUN7292 TaxID=3422499 RepID=UPI003D7D3C4A
MKVVLVDDELQMLNWLQLMLEKTEFPAELKGTFANGREAYEYCMEHPVDLVITDIRMPLMDGLQLIQQLKSNKPHVRFLILSAYEEFHYASEGMRLGASNYLLKAEITVDELNEALKRISNDISNEQRIGDELKNMRKAINENQQALRNVYLKELIRGEEKAIVNFLHKKEFLQLKLEMKYPVVLAVGFEAAEFEQKAAQFKSRELLELAVVNVVEETLEAELGIGNSCPMDTGLFAVTINIPNTGSKSIRERMLHFANRISVNLWSYLKLHAAIGISEIYGNITELNQRWKEAGQALGQNLFYGRQVIVCYQDIIFDIQSRTHEEKGRTLYEKAAQLLEIDYYDELQEELFRLVRAIEEKKHLLATDVKSVFLEIAYMMRRKLQSLSAAPVENVRFVGIDQAATFQDCKAWLLDQVNDFMSVVNKNKRSPAITEVCQYVEQNYMGNVSLQEAASIVHLNKTYLSGLFKKEMGVNFNDYLTQIRLDKARELIVTNQCNIGELAEKVGYTNSSHFTKVFKKTMGMSPLEFKKNKK